MPSSAAARTLLLGAALAAVLVTVAWIALAVASRTNPLAAATRAATGRGYTFHADTHTSLAGADAVNHVRGSGTTFMTITFTAGDPPGPETVVVWPTVESGGVPLPARSLALLLPGGDPLALVAAGHAPAPTRDESGRHLVPPQVIGGRTCIPYSFRVAGGSYLPWWQDHPATLPVNADAGGLPTFTARASMAVDEATHLPCRITAVFDLPRVAGEQPGTAWVEWTYDAWSENATPPATQ